MTQTVDFNILATSDKSKLSNSIRSENVLQTSLNIVQNTEEKNSTHALTGAGKNPSLRFG